MRPDFAVTAVAFEGPVPTVNGEAFIAQVTVENRGQVAGNAGTLHLFASKPAWAVPADTVSADASVPAGMLEPGQAAVFEVPMTTPEIRGIHHLRAYVVSPETEWSTGDNQKATTYWIQTIDLKIQVVPGEGTRLTWNNYWGDIYSVYRKVGFDGEYELLAEGIPSARPDPVNEFLDTHPPAESPVFYKVSLTP